jgi:hypothetical protein
MTLTANKYKILKEKNKWEAPSAEEEKIMALEARITKMAEGNQSSNKTKPTSKTSKPAASKDMSWKYVEPPEMQTRENPARGTTRSGGGVRTTRHLSTTSLMNVRARVSNQTHRPSPTRTRKTQRITVNLNLKSPSSRE